MITGVFVIGGIKIINDLFTENEDNLNQEQYFKDVDRDSVDHKNNNNRFRFRSSNYLFVTMQKKTSLSPMSRYSVDRRKKVRICNNKQARH